MAVRVIVVTNLKGGSGKTTTVGYLAHVLRGLGYRVIVVDADPRGAAVRWQGLASWPIPAIGLATPQLHRQLWGVVDPGRYDVVLIDTPPLEEQAGIVSSALRAVPAGDTNDIVVTLAPSTSELDSIGPVYRAIAAVADTNPNPRVAALLNRTVHRARSTGLIRARLEARGRRVLTATVPRLEEYAMSFGAAVDEHDEPYLAVARELLDAAA